MVGDGCEGVLEECHGQVAVGVARHHRGRIDEGGGTPIAVGWPLDGGAKSRPGVTACRLLGAEFDKGTPVARPVRKATGLRRGIVSETAGSPKDAFGFPDVRPTRRDSL